MRRVAAPLLGAASLAFTSSALAGPDTPAPAPGDQRSWELDGTLELEYAPNVTVHSPRTQKLQLVAEPRLRASLGGGVGVTLIGRLASELSDNLDPRSPDTHSYSRPSEPLTLGDRTELELRELYLDFPVGPALVRLGKQQAVWGEADGLKVLDVIDPQDFSEFILDDFDDSRIPLWTLNVEIPIADSTLQLLWIPDPSFHRIPGTDEERPIEPYAFTAPSFRPVIPVQLGQFVDFAIESDRPGWKPSNWDAGWRLSTVFRGWDLSLNSIWQRDDTPVLVYGAERLVFAPPKILLQVDTENEHKRRTIIGGTFSRAIGDLTVRGELAYSIGRAFSVAYRFDATGLDPPVFLRSDEVSYVIGLDWYGVRSSFFSAQLFQTVVVDHHREMLAEALTTTLTFAAQRRFLNDRLVLEVTTLVGADHGDGLVRPKASFEICDGLEVWTGADLFFGGRNGIFGQFQNNSRLVLGFALGV